MHNLSYLNSTVIMTNIVRLSYFISFVLVINNIFLHSIGILLLREKGRRTVQGLYLMNLLLAEIMGNVIRFTGIFIYLFCQKRLQSGIWSAIVRAFSVVTWTSIYYLYFLSMFFLTLDRLLVVLLIGKYRRAKLKQKIRVILLSTWLISLFTGILFAMLDYFEHFTYFISVEILGIIIPTVLSIIFLVMALLSYTVMFRKFSHSMRRISQHRAKHESLFQIFLKSEFFISVLLITSYLIFTVFPNVVFACAWYKGRSSLIYIDVVVTICTCLSDTADALIYIFLQKRVRRLLLRNLRLIRENCYCISTFNKDEESIREEIPMLPLSLKNVRTNKTTI